MNGQVQPNRQIQGPGSGKQPPEFHEKHPRAQERQSRFMYRWIQRNQIDRILAGSDRQSRS